MTIHVLADNVLLKLTEEDTVTSTGLIQAHSAGEKTEAWGLKAMVVGIGPDAGAVVVTIGNRKQNGSEVKLGDTVYVGKWEVQHVQIDGTRYAVAKAKDILLVVEK